MDNALYDLMDGFSAADDDQAVLDAFGSFGQRFGFHCFTYAVFRAGGVLCFQSSFPETWRERYLARGYDRIDPVVRATFQRTVPFNWDEACRGGLDPAQQRIFDEARECGLWRGLTVPIRESGGDIAVVSLAAGRDRLAPDRTASGHLVRMGSLHLHEALLRRDEGRKAVRGPDPDLSRGERECLLWAARGKSAWDVAGILGLSEDEVHSHGRSAMAKMGVATRAQALARAIASAQIVP
ncbi:MAG: LuxR family transcriptional regulator [Alphaproteobacteria bacterium]|nr:LuxR family transcriptional regulator [Alphaproteobacteria bacterium]